MKIIQESTEQNQPYQKVDYNSQLFQNNISISDAVNNLQQLQKKTYQIAKQLQMDNQKDIKNNASLINGVQNSRFIPLQINYSRAVKNTEENDQIVFKPKSIIQQIKEINKVQTKNDLKYQDDFNSDKILKLENFQMQSNLLRKKNLLQIEMNDKTSFTKIQFLQENYQMEKTEQTELSPQFNSYKQNFNNFNIKQQVQNDTERNYEFDQYYDLFKKKTKSNKHFQIVTDLLVKTFSNDRLTNQDLSNLKSYQLQVYLKILERRFKTKINCSQSVDELLKYLNSRISNGPNSYLRSEEQYKFVLKKVIRIMKLEIKKELADQKQPNTNSYVNKQFLVKYFQSLAHQLQLSLDVFIPPTNINFKSTFKTVNKDYFSLIKKSKLFVKDFMRIVDYVLIPFYKREIADKFSYLTRQFNEQLLNCDSMCFDKQVCQIIHFLSIKKKLKLPWDIKTVKMSIKITIDQFFNQFYFKNNLNYYYGKF